MIAQIQLLSFPTAGVPGEQVQDDAVPLGVRAPEPGPRPQPDRNAGELMLKTLVLGCMFGGHLNGEISQPRFVISVTVMKFAGQDLVPKPPYQVEEAEPRDGRQQRHAPLPPGRHHVPTVRRAPLPLPSGATGKKPLSS